jgi:hypothetical protein
LRPQPRQPKEIEIRRGPVFYEVKFREEAESKWRTTSVPRAVPMKDAADYIAGEYCRAHPDETITLGWRLTDEEIAAGKKGFEWPK